MTLTTQDGQSQATQHSCPPRLPEAILQRPDVRSAAGSRFGICHGFVEQLWLLWNFRVFLWITLSGTLFISCGALNILYLPSLQAKLWNTPDDPMRAGRNVELLTALRNVVTVLLVPHMGRYCDRRGLLFGMRLAVVSTLAPGVALLILGPTDAGLWVYSAVWVLCGALGVSISGCPLLYALVSSILPPESLENGIALLSVFSCLGSLVNNFVGSVVQRSFADFRALVVFQCGVGLLALLCLVPVTLPATPEPFHLDAERRCEALEPMRLAWKRRGLFYIGIVAGLLSFSENAMYGGFVYNYVFAVLGPSDAQAQAQSLLLFCTYPNVIMMVLFSLIGVVSRRFGPCNVLFVAVPLTSVLFSAPLLLMTSHSPVLVFITGGCLQTALLCFVPLQALVCHVAPKNRIAEAQGAIAAVKALASILAPMATALFLRVLSMEGASDASWTIFPGMSFLMVMSVFAVWRLQRKLGRKDVLRRSASTGWGAWASPQVSVLADDMKRSFSSWTPQSRLSASPTSGLLPSPVGSWRAPLISSPRLFAQASNPSLPVLAEHRESHLGSTCDDFHLDGFTPAPAENSLAAEAGLQGNTDTTDKLHKVHESCGSNIL